LLSGRGRRALDALRRRVDVLVGFDPGLNQFLMAVSVVVCVGCSIGVAYLFMQATHLLWVGAPHGVSPAPAQLAALAAQHHGETLLAMLFAGIVGMLTAFAVADTKPRELGTTMVLLPIPMLAMVALSVQFVHERALGILVMAVVMAVAVYVPKFAPRIGQRAFVLGMMLFVGYLFGFLSRGAITTGDLGSVAAILWVSAAVNFAVRLFVFVPLTHGAVTRTIQAFFARSRGVINCSAQLFAAPDERARARLRRRLHRRLARLNEAALIVDAQLATRPEIAQSTHARLFATELGVQNIGRLSDALCDADLPPDVRAAIAASLLDARDTRGGMRLVRLATVSDYGTDTAVAEARPLVAGRVMRLADALFGWKLSTDTWRQVAPQRASEPAAFETPVTLMFGNLPGSALVSRGAAAPPGTLRARLGLDFPAQSAIRLGVAVVVAASLGSLLSDRRFYWAVLAVFVSYMGTNTSGEQLIKAGQRVGGTVIGILIGSLLANAIGYSTWSIPVVLAALFLGIYFMRASYALMVLGITITVSQLYVQLGEYTNHLLVLRLEETAIGAAVAMLAALVIFPIHARQATQVAARDFYARLGELLDGLVRRLSGEPAALTAASRALDNAGHALRSAALPLSRLPFRSDDVEHNLLLFGLAAHHVRNIAAEVDEEPELDDQVRGAAVATLRCERRFASALQQHTCRLALGDGGNGDGATGGDDEVPGTLSQRLRFEGDLLAVALEGRGSLDERRLLRSIARLDETLAELGDNLLRGDDRDTGSTPSAGPLALDSGSGNHRHDARHPAKTAPLRFAHMGRAGRQMGSRALVQREGVIPCRRGLQQTR
jgi:Fusaric acid resistance protein-like